MRPKAFPKEASSWPALSLLVLLVVLFYWKVLFAHEVLVFIDSSRFFFPVWKWGAAAWRQGTIPLWNPDAQFGAPYFADPQMAGAYPPVALFYTWLTPTNAFSALVILHHLWALLGVWTFSRAQGFTARASLFGAVIFGFSLHVVCSAWTPPALMAISWLPWVFWAAEKVYRKERGGPLYLSIAWAMQLAAGYPVLTYLAGLVLFLHFSFKSVDSPGKMTARFHWIGWFVLASLLAVAYNLSWGLPFLDLFRHSNYRNGATNFQNLGMRNLGTFLEPFAQGHPALSTYTGPLYWVSTYFVGLPVLCLVLWGAWRDLYRRSFLEIFFIVLMLSMAGSMGLGPTLWKVLPGYALIVHSGFWLSSLCLLVAWMTMEALERFLSVENKTSPTWAWILAVVAVYGASMVLHKPYFPLYFVVSFLLLLFSVLFRNSWVRWFLVMIALGLSLGPAAVSLNVTFDRSFYEDPPEVLAKLDKPGRLFFSPVLLRDEGSYLQGRDMKGAYRCAKEKCFPNWPLGFGREEVPIYNTLRSKDTDDWAIGATQYSLGHSRRVLDFLGVRYVIGNVQWKDFRPMDIGPVRVFENPTPLPKWFLVGQAISAAATVEEDFEKASKMGLNYGKNCFIADASKAGNYQLRSGSVLEVGRGIDALEMAVKGKGVALLVSSETADAGWKAWVEGRPVNIEKIDHAFRGVVLNDGEERVQLRYEPMTFRLGLFSALLVCGAWFAMGLLKSRDEH